MPNTDVTVSLLSLYSMYDSYKLEMPHFPPSSAPRPPVTPLPQCVAGPARISPDPGYFNRLLSALPLPRLAPPHLPSTATQRSC